MHGQILTIVAPAVRRYLERRRSWQGL